MLLHKKDFGEVHREYENNIHICMLYSYLLVNWIKHVKIFLSAIKEK